MYEQPKLLTKFAKEIIKKIDKVKKRADLHKNSNISTNNNYVDLVFESYDNLEIAAKNLSRLKINKNNSVYDITIKMWDRKPEKDIFQGNYSTCCIGMGRRNGDMMARYLLNTCFNMIEIVDNKNGKIIGNALCYFAEVDNELAFIIDNVEINNSRIPVNEAGDDIRSALVEYSRNLLGEVSDNKNIKIYMGCNRNDIPLPSDIPIENKFIKFIGDIRSDIYLDVYGGYIFISYELSQNVNLCRLS